MSVIPIRPGMSPESDRVQGLIDYVAESIKTFSEHDEPVSIGLAIIGKKKAIPVGMTTDESSMALAMAFAGALLTNRAAQG